MKPKLGRPKGTVDSKPRKRVQTARPNRIHVTLSDEAMDIVYALPSGRFSAWIDAAIRKAGKEG